MAELRAGGLTAVAEQVVAFFPHCNAQLYMATCTGT